MVHGKTMRYPPKEDFTFYGAETWQRCKLQKKGELWSASKHIVESAYGKEYCFEKVEPTDAQPLL